MPRDGSFALAFLGRVSRVHDPIFSVALGRNNRALKRIVGLVSCSLAGFIYCYTTKQNEQIASILLSETHGLIELKRAVQRADTQTQSRETVCAGRLNKRIQQSAAKPFGPVIRSYRHCDLRCGGVYK